MAQAIAARMDWRSDPADDVHPDDELDAWSRAVCEWLCHHQPAGPTLAQVAACATPDDLLTLSTTAPRPDHPDVACAVLARWLDLVVRAPDARVLDIASYELARASTGGGLGRQFRVAEASGWRVLMCDLKADGH